MREKMTLWSKEEFERLCKEHKKCKDPELEECIYCGANDCPHSEPLHYHHDGCPACCFEDVNVGEDESC